MCPTRGIKTRVPKFQTILDPGLRLAEEKQLTWSNLRYACNVSIALMYTE
jgi:hypothetical protein